MTIFIYPDYTVMTHLDLYMTKTQVDDIACVLGKFHCQIMQLYIEKCQNEQIQYWLLTDFF